MLFKRSLLLRLAENVIIVFIVVELILKNIFREPRPTIDNPACPIGFSFPSSHAAISFAIATVLTAHDKKRWWLYYFMATVIAYSRVYLNCHTLLEVVIGALIGYFLSKAVNLHVDHRRRKS